MKIQHRDIKPENLLLVGGSVKVADCGLAKIVERAGPCSVLTPTYAAPEQVRGLITSQSDQYSLALTYCHLRKDRLPFEDKHLIDARNRGEPNLTMLPDEERRTVARALAVNPEQRWPSCLSFAQALVRGKDSGAALAGRSPADRPK